MCRIILILTIFLGKSLSVLAQKTEKITYAVSIGYFSEDSLKNLFPYINEYTRADLGRIHILKTKNKQYRVFAGYRICYNEALKLFEKMKQSPLYNENAKIIAFNCLDEIALEEAEKLCNYRCIENAASVFQNKIDSAVPFDYFYYKVLAFSNIDSVQRSKLSYLNKLFPDDTISIDVLKSCDGKNTILYKVFIGNYECENKAKEAREKLLLTDGFLFSMVNGEKTPVYIYNCTKEKGRKGHILFEKNNNCK